MNELWDNDEFCRDLTSDLLSERELSSLCYKTVRTARRRRRMRQGRVVLLLALLTLTAWQVLRPQAPELAQRTPKKPERAFTLLRSEEFSNVLTTEPDRSAVFFAGIEPAPLLLSPEVPTFNTISDEQLLSFFEGKAVALVRIPGGKMELEFLDRAEPPTATRSAE